jgi:hypothetical protein
MKVNEEDINSLFGKEGPLKLPLLRRGKLGTGLIEPR